MSLNVAIVTWFDNPDDVARTIYPALLALGHNPIYIGQDALIPEGIDLVFTYAPWGRLQQITHQLAERPASQRPLWAHWNTEDPPDPRWPRPIILPVSQLKAWFDRFNDAEKQWQRGLLSLPGLNWFNERFYKFRYVGEYNYGQRQNLLTTFADGSRVYTDFFNSLGLKTVYAPWGSLNDTYDDLNLERDIDVLWLGTRRTKRRSDLLDHIRTQLTAQGVNMVVVDGVENPTVWGPERTKLFNRAKLSLNLLATWYDNTLLYRFPLAAANKSMVISETSLAHDPVYQNHVHYVAVPSEEIVPTILHYLNHEQERVKVAEQGYRLATQQLKLHESVKIIMDTVLQSHPQIYETA